MASASPRFVKQVAAVLQGHLVDRIEFTFDSEKLYVSGLRLWWVGEAIARGQIRVAIGPTGTELDAAYSAHSNTMTLIHEHVADWPPGCAAILHEGVHALVDLFECTSTTEITDEAAAYLAETIYRYFGKIDVRKEAGANGDPTALAIFDAAHRLAAKYGLYKKRGARLTGQQYEPLRKAVHHHEAYSGISLDQLTSGHGVPD